MSIRLPKAAPSSVPVPEKPVELQSSSAYPLAMFRLLFGSILVRFFWDLFNSSWVEDQFENALYLPTYGWCEGLVVSAFAIRLSLVVLIVSSVCLAIGLFYRLNCFVLLAFYSYVYLADPTWATSSKYLIWVLIALFTLTHGHAVASIDSNFLKWLHVAELRVPSLHLTAFKIIFTLVPLYSGFAKWMSADWMERAEPLSTLLLFGSVSTSYPAWAFLSGPSFGYTPSALADIGFVVSYAIVAIEIVGTTALWGPTWLRWLGLLATALLALIHSNIAQGVYPYIIICSFCLWLPAKRSKSILQALHTLNTVSTTSTASTPSTSSASHLVPPEAVKQAAKNNSKVKKSIKSPSIAERLSTFFSRQLPLFILCAFLLFQAIAPAVPYFSKHDPSWASHANSLSWRMMLLTQDTLVQWHSFTYEHPLTNPPQLASAIVLHHSEDEAWTSKAVNADTWLSIRNSAALLYQWSVRRVMPEIVKKYGSDMIPLSAYRSINGRPYQPWIRLDRSDVKTSRCSRWFGCDELLEPQIEEYNTMDWLVRKQIWTDEWIAKGFESVYFAQRSGGMEFAFNFKRFSKRLHLVLLAGEVQVISALGETSKPLRGEQLPIDFEVYHEVRTTSTEPAAWAFIWPWPRNMTLADALSQ